MVLNVYQELLNKTYSFVDESQIARIGKYLNRASRVFVCGHLNHGNAISPQFPILVMLDIIFSYLLEQNKYEKETLHDNTLKALREN